MLKKAVGCYQHTLKGHVRSEFKGEVEWWMKEGILILWKEKVESGVLPLIAVVQPVKFEVRLVLDF